MSPHVVDRAVLGPMHYQKHVCDDNEYKYTHTTPHKHEHTVMFENKMSTPHYPELAPIKFQTDTFKPSPCTIASSREGMCNHDQTQQIRQQQRITDIVDNLDVLR